jgi:hypothetical protein
MRGLSSSSTVKLWNASPRQEKWWGSLASKDSSSRRRMTRFGSLVPSTSVSLVRFSFNFSRFWRPVNHSGNLPTVPRPYSLRLWSFLGGVDKPSSPECTDSDSRQLSMAMVDQTLAPPVSVLLLFLGPFSARRSQFRTKKVYKEWWPASRVMWRICLSFCLDNWLLKSFTPVFFFSFSLFYQVTDLAPFELHASTQHSCWPRVVSISVHNNNLNLFVVDFCSDLKLGMRNFHGTTRLKSSL